MSVDSVKVYRTWKDLAVKMCKLCGSKIMEDVNKRNYLESHSNDLASGSLKTGVVSIKSTVADLVTETDQEVERMIKEMIKQNYPDHFFVGEETSEETGGKLSLTNNPTWVVDPIDGTTNFVHKNPGFCVSIGVLHNKRPVVGVVYEVFGDNLYWAVEGMGAYRNGESLSVTDCDKLEKCLLMTETTSRRDEQSISDVTKTISNLLAAGLSAMRMTGSAALNLCKVAEGSADGYYEIGPHIWDVAAAAVILTEAGGHLLHPKTLEPAALEAREFLAVGEKVELAKLISPHVEKSFQLESD